MNTIQARELRIGNLVKFTEDKELYAGYHNKVNVVDFDTLKDIEFNNSKWYEPIQLTEDWLVRLGFISNPYFDRYEKDSFHIEHDATQGYSQFWNSRAGVTFKTVHHLQNYYHALTGTELTLTDK